MIECNHTSPEKIKEKDFYNDFIKLHSYQLETSEIPKHFWHTIVHKLDKQIYDAGDYFQMCQTVEDEDSDNVQWEVIVIHPSGMKASDSNNIFLIDHAWSYQTTVEAKISLEQCEGLLERMCNLMDIKTEKVENEILIEQVLKEMWKFNGTYSLGMGPTSLETSVRMWYVMDEFGSRIQHDGDPNFRVVPFYYYPHKCCFSLLFPIKDIKEGVEVTRNFVEAPTVDSLTRDAQMLPWFVVDMTSLNLKQEEPSIDHFESERLPESLPDSPPVLTSWLHKRSVKVYSDYEYINEYLTDSKFEVISSMEEADILWLSTHFKDFRSLAESPTKRINQYPSERVIVVKNLLAIICRRCGEATTESVSSNAIEGKLNPPWVIPTFCLKREIAHFVSCFQKRQKLDLDNTWIIKPWNLARGIDHTITNNLNHILRLPSTGPKIAQKYLHSPVLFYREDIDARVKFDLRFIVLLLNVKPLEIAIYKNFWIRFANKKFEMNDFEDYEKHFTVNNYNDSGLVQMFCHDFIEKFEAQYPAFSWRSLQDKIYTMVRELFIGATQLEPPRGIAHNPQSKGCYGLDVIFDWEKDEIGTKTMQPKLLEVNFNSDCKRACEYYPNFFNDLFNAMFLEERNIDSIEILK